MVTENSSLMLQNAISNYKIENRIFTMRGTQIMLDSHLGELYGVESKLINKAVKRNKDRFPEKFMFQLTENEWKLLNLELKNQITDQNLKYQFGTSSFGPEILPGSHDRFLVIDSQELYHIGASLKDLGRKWFAFSRMDSLTNELLNKLKR